MGPGSNYALGALNSSKTVSDGRHDTQSVPNGAVVLVKRGSGNCHRWARAFSRCDTSPENG